MSKLPGRSLRYPVSAQSTSRCFSTETVITKVQKFTVLALAAMLILVMVLSTVLIAQKIWGAADVAHRGPINTSRK